MGDRVYRWFVRIGNQFTNQVVADWVEMHGISQADAQPEIECNDGITRSLWECSYSLISDLRKSGIAQLDYTVWVAEGNGKPRPWALSKKTRRKKSTT